MLSTLLTLLGSVLMLLTIMIAMVFMVAGVLRRNPVNIRALTASGIAGLLMIVLGVLPWWIAEVIGIVVLVAGGFAFCVIWLRRYEEGKLKKEMFKVRDYIRRDRIEPALRFLARILMVVGGLLLIDMIGLSFFLFFMGHRNLLRFLELLTILLLLEGVLISAGGAFMFYGYSEYRIAGQGAINPAIAADQRQRWRERRLSQQKWGVGMIIAGVLIIILGLIVSLGTTL